ncbi:MAG: putative cytokinetic ring protein SteA [Solirubrobacterales bacterium]
MGAARIAGRVRRGKRTKDLVKKLAPGEIAVIDHADLDRIASEDLAGSGVVAVLNNAASSTDRYPNVGPLLLVRAGVPVIDFRETDLFELLSDGDLVEIDGGGLLRDGEQIAIGNRLSESEMRARLAAQRARIDRALGEFATNTIEHVREESELLTGEIEFPTVRTRFRDRHTLIVVRGPDYREDLGALGAYIRDVRPLIVAVDGGADAVLEAGFKPDVILGDMDSATDKALGAGAELIVHAYADGGAPGRERLEALGLAHVVVPAPGTSQDVAMLLAYELGARLIVTVGAHFNLIEFLDKNRAGMSSTFLTRLRVGETLVDAKGVSRLYRPGMGVSGAAMFLAAFVVLLVIVLVAAPALDNVTELLWLKIQDALGI